MENGRWVKPREYCDAMGVRETTMRLGKKAGSIKHRMISAKMYQLWLPDDREVAPVGSSDKEQVEQVVVSTGKGASKQPPVVADTDNEVLETGVVEVEGVGSVRTNARIDALLQRKAEFVLEDEVGKLEQQVLGYITEADVKAFRKQQKALDERQDELDRIHEIEDYTNNLKSVASRTYYRLADWHSRVSELVDGVDGIKEMLREAYKSYADANKWSEYAKAGSYVRSLIEVAQILRKKLDELLELPSVPRLDDDDEGYTEEDTEDTGDSELFDDEDEQETDEVDAEQLIEAVEKAVDKEVEQVESEVPVFEIKTANKKRGKK